MEKFKICPVCGMRNKPNMIECLGCETDLTSVKATDEETEKQDLIKMKCNKLILGKKAVWKLLKDSCLMIKNELLNDAYEKKKYLYMDLVCIQSISVKAETGLIGLFRKQI